MIHEPPPERTGPVLVDPDGITSCCGAYTSISADDGVEYCKVCFRGVDDYTSTPTQRTTIQLPTAGDQ